MDRQDFFDMILKNIQRIAPLRMSVAQTRFRNHEFSATFANILESLIHELVLNAIDRFKDTPYSIQGEAGAAAVFTYPTNIS